MSTRGRYKEFILFFILLFVPISIFSSELVKIKEINTKEIIDGISIEIILDKPISYQYFTLENPPRLVVNLYDVAVNPQTISIDKAMAKTLRIAQFQNKPKLIARAVVDLTQIPKGINVSKKDNLILINLNTGAVSKVSSAEETLTIPVSQSTTAQTSSVEVAPKVKVDTQVEVKKEEKPKSIEKVSLDFRDAEISDVLWILAKKAGVNIIGKEDLKGKVTIHLDSVDPKDALDMILKLYGYAYEQQSENIFRIIKTETKSMEGRIEKAEKVFMTKSFVITYAKASQIAATVSKMLSADGVMQADDPSNTLIVIDSPTNIESIGKMIEELDLPPKQVLIEVKFAEISSTKGEDFRTIWNRIGSTNSEVKGKISFTSLPMSGSGFGITVSTADLDALIELLKSSTDFNLMSTPQIVTLDNREARIQVGEQIPYKKTTVIASGGITTTSEEIIYLDVGVVLSVTPHISGENSVIVDIKPIVSDYQYSKDVPGVPIITTRNLESRVLILDGQTLIVGGLMKDDVKKTEYKVPILGDIPILGYLFKYTTQTKTKVNLVIFITPHIIK